MGTVKQKISENMITRHRNQGNNSNNMGSLLFPDIHHP